MIRNFHPHVRTGATRHRRNITLSKVQQDESKPRRESVSSEKRCCQKVSSRLFCCVCGCRSDSRTVPESLPPFHAEGTAASSSVLFHFIVFSCSSAQLADVRSDVDSELLALECNSTIKTLMINSTTITGTENKVNL